MLLPRSSFAPLGVFCLQPIIKQSDTMGHSSPASTWRLFERKCSWGGEQSQLLSTTALLFLPRLHLLKLLNPRTILTIKYQNRQGWRKEKRAPSFGLLLMQKCSWGGGRSQLLSTAAPVFLPRLHLLNESNNSNQRRLPSEWIKTAIMEKVEMRNKPITWDCLNSCI